MPDHVAIKLLTEKSDLGWFKSIFDRRNLAGKQKGIALNKEIFRKFYPGLSFRATLYAKAKEKLANARAISPPDKIAIDKAKSEARRVGTLPVFTTIYGPGGGQPFTRQRVIALQDKNWRLNGKFILDPEGEPNRFDPILQDGDIAILGFEGREQPTAISVLLLAAGSVHDRPLYEAFRPKLTKGVGSMIALGPDSLAEIADVVGLPPSHPLRLFTIDTAIERDLEEVARGSVEAVKRVQRKRPGRHITPEELAAAKVKAEDNGRLGEALVDARLKAKCADDLFLHRWKSKEITTHPYDFELIDVASNNILSVIDVKTTGSSFSSEFYMSYYELDFASRISVPYRIYRVYEVGQSGAWLRISDDVRELASAILERATSFPEGARPTVFAIAPNKADFGKGHWSLSWSRAVRLDPLAPLAPVEEDLSDPDYEDHDESAEAVG